jgi:hypothetical protein
MVVISCQSDSVALELAPRIGHPHTSYSQLPTHHRILLSLLPASQRSRLIFDIAYLIAVFFSLKIRVRHELVRQGTTAELIERLSKLITVVESALAVRLDMCAEGVVAAEARGTNKHCRNWPFNKIWA